MKMVAMKHGYLDQASSVESSGLQTKVNRATSPISFNQEKCEDRIAVEELEHIYEELEELRRELDRERGERLHLEQQNLLL